MVFVEGDNPHCLPLSLFQGLELKGKSIPLTPLEGEILNKMKSVLAQITYPKEGLSDKLKELLPVAKMEAKKRDEAEAQPSFEYQAEANLESQVEVLKAALASTSRDVTEFGASFKRAQRDFAIMAGGDALEKASASKRRRPSPNW